MKAVRLNFLVLFSTAIFMAIVSAMAAIFVSAQTISEATTHPATTASDGLKVVSLKLLGPVSEIEGLAWLPGDRDGIAANVTIEDTRKLVIHLPNGTTIESPAKTTFITQQKGIIKDVIFVPTMQLLHYQDAITELENFMKGWNCQLDARSKGELAKGRTWGDLEAAYQADQPGVGVIPGENKIIISYRLRSAQVGWFLSISVGNMPDATTRVVTQPSTRSVLRERQTLRD